LSKGYLKEQFIKYLLFFCALSSVLFLAGIIWVLFREGLPVFSHVSLLEFISGRDWYPYWHPPDFGILPLISASLVVTTGAMVIAVPIGLFSAIFIAFILPLKLKKIVKPITELLASIPSVIFGLFGMQILAPVLRDLFNLPSGFNALNAMIMLGIMALPTIISLSEDALTAVPEPYREASLALGSTRWEAISKVIIPAALSGIATAVILGLGRAIGETMVVLMVAGGAAVMPTDIFRAVKPMTATIAAEMGETSVGSPHYHSLFGIGIVLFFITLLFNIIADYFTQKFQSMVGGES